MSPLAKLQGQLICGSELRDFESYFHDQSGEPYQLPEFLVFAQSTQDVKIVVEYCVCHKKKLTIVGGRTGYSGGANSRGGVVLSVEKMNQIVSFHPQEGMITVQAGMITDAVSLVAEKENLIYPIKFAASGSSQIGGNIATNAGGVHVIRYGMTRSQVLALEVVTGRGDVLNTNAAVLKDNSGISLKDIFIGSEGKLGIVTQATLRLVPRPENLFTLVAATPSLQAVHELFRMACHYPSLHAFEFWDFSCYELLRDKVMKKPLFSQDYPFYVLMEWEFLHNFPERFLAEASSKNLILDATYSEIPAVQKSLWQWRERISEELKKNFVLYKFDISIPLPLQGKFIDTLKLTVEKDFPNTKIFLFGHVADGNLHLNIADLQREHCVKDKITNFVYELVLSNGGSISAEHGLGKGKVAYYQKFYPLNWYYNQKIQEIFDPVGIFS